MEFKTALLRNLQTGWLEAGQTQSENLLFFIHGCPDTPEIWNNQIAALAQDHHIIAPYLRGIGTSSPSPKKQRYSIFDHAHDFKEILKIVDPEQKKKVSIIGHDIGGLYAYALAQLIPEQLKQLVFINALPTPLLKRRLLNKDQLLKSWYIFFFQIPFLSDIVVKNYGSILLNLAFERGGLMPEEHNIQASLTPFLNHYRQAMSELTKNLLLPNSIKAIEKPILAIWGVNDPFLEIPTIEEFKKVGSQVTVRVLEGGHWLQKQMPTRINHLIGGQLVKPVKRPHLSVAL